MDESSQNEQSTRVGCKLQRQSLARVESYYRRRQITPCRDNSITIGTIGNGQATVVRIKKKLL